MIRKSEKIGWIAGWSGAFIWFGLLSVIWLFQDKIIDGVSGLVLFVISILTIITTAPWKHPDIKYWKLMLPVYLLFFCSIILAISLSGGIEAIGLKWQSIFWVIPGFIPFVTVGNRTWNNRA